MISLNFTYFPNWERFAAVTQDDCSCPDELPCLEPIFFEDPDVEMPVCITELASGETRVIIPPYLRQELATSVRENFPELDDLAQQSKVESAIDELSRTPPVPWIQHNAWPVSQGNFCRYLGEWDQDALATRSETGDGKSFLWSILSADYRRRRDSVESLWTEMESGKTVVYVFECLTSGKLIAIDQSY